jgi:hypothetical protein
MKKFIYGLAALGLVGVFVFISNRKESLKIYPAISAAPKTIQVTPVERNPSARSSAFDGKATASSATDQNASTLIPLVDRTNPAFATIIRQLDSEFLGYLRYTTREQHVEPSELEEAVKLLSTVRLSQMMHEATIATVISSTDKAVTISIPAYEAEGRSLQRYLESKLNPAFVGQGPGENIETSFSFFGKYNQKIEVSPEGEFRGDTTYTIAHEINLRPILGGLKTYSTLTRSTLGGYGVFESLFPKP